MYFLDKFWKGDIAPGEGRYHPSETYKQAFKTMERSEDILKAHLSQEDYQIFQEYMDASIKASSTDSCENFIEGFRMGARMMLDVLTDIGS